MLRLTNAQKGALFVAINATLAAALSFGIDVSEAQRAAIELAVNGWLGVWLKLTYKKSPKRIPDA